MKLDLTHLERRGMTMAHEISDESPILVDLLGSLSIGNSSGLNNRFVRTQIINHSDKSIVQHFKRDTQDLIQSFDLHPIDFAGSGYWSGHQAVFTLVINLTI